MAHPFEPNSNKPGFCSNCGHAKELHGDAATCESCTNVGTLNPALLNGRGAMLCDSCYEREINILKAQGDSDYQSPEKQEARLTEYKKIARPYELLIQDAQKIDESIHLDTDIFNAKTIAFQDLRDAINADETIPADEKRFELARVAKERIFHLQQVIFNLDKQKINVYSEQKSWHIQLNDLANKLRTDERERLKISDIHYDVKLPKVVTPRAIKTSTKAPSKAELRKLAEELKMPEFTIQLVMTSKNWTLEQAGNHLRRTIKEGQSMNEPKAVTEVKSE